MKDATIARLTAELEAARKDNAALEEAYEETLGHCEAWAERAEKAEAEQAGVVMGVNSLIAVVRGYQNMPGFSVHPMVDAQINVMAQTTPASANAAYTAAIRAAEVRGMREAAGIAQNNQAGATAGFRGIAIARDILAAATAKENARE